MGWITTGAYALAAWLCARAYAVKPVIHGAGEARAHRFWSMLTIAMVALTINKQLDLQSLLTAIARRMAHDGGWYGMRRTVQRVFIIVVMLTGGAALGLMLLHLRRVTYWVRLAGLGLTLLVVFVVTRAASFHHMDAMLGTEWVGVRVNHLLELSGIAMIALGAAGDRRFRIDTSTRRQL